MKKIPNFPFPQYLNYEIKPMLPSDKKPAWREEKIIGLFRQFLLNDLIVDTNSPANKDEFRMIFRHYQSWAIEEDGLDVSHLTVSESHGYGMMMLAYMAGSENQLNLSSEQWIYDCESLHDYFNAMLRTVLTFPSVIGDEENKLFAWELKGYPRDGTNQTGYKQENGFKTAPFTKLPTSSCATDGDMDIIYSLLLADRQWGSDGDYNYKQIALEMLKWFWKYCVHREYHTLLLGDWSHEREGVKSSATRPSDFILSHLKAYAKADPHHDWQLVINATYDVIHDIRTAENILGHENGMLPDFVIRGQDKWEVPSGSVLEGDTDKDFAFNACRVPWRLATDYLICGNTKFGTKNLLDDIIAPLDKHAKKIGNPDEFGPFKMDGSLMDITDPHLFAPPFLLTAAANAAGQEWVNKIWDWDGLSAYQGDNYADYIKLMVMLTASGNYWMPV
ncbi:MAG: glycosyl hydrolase family 8 [Lachnospiraceae bacterium]|nr:glycosyl hydrolase family 8 [Lachnospiraceae bacterium]